MQKGEAACSPRHAEKRKEREQHLHQSPGENSGAVAALSPPLPGEDSEAVAERFPKLPGEKMMNGGSTFHTNSPGEEW